MDHSAELLTRAVESVVPEDLAKKKLASGKPLRLYLGIDPTGAKLHLGHSVPLRKLKAFQDAGHHVIFLVGSFTAMIGDPSGRENMRDPLTRKQVEDNFQTYKEQAAKILDFSRVELRYNHEWLDSLNFKDITKLASNFTVQQMLQRETFKRRMWATTQCPQCGDVALLAKLDEGQPLLQKFQGDLWSFEIDCKKCQNKWRPSRNNIDDASPVWLHEFLYPLMQGYDSVMLDVDLEVGGNDQLFNMLCGRTLQQAFGKREKFVLTTRLIEGTDGRKMSKTYDNCIWLEDAAGEMYGKLLSIKDDLILPYMECVTEMPMEEVRAAEKALKEGTNPKELKMRLAREVVTLYHGADTAKAAEEEFQKVFSKGGLPEEMEEVTVPAGTLLVDLIAAQKLAPSKTAARRLIRQGAVKLDDRPVTALDAKAEPGVLKVGKRKFLRIITASAPPPHPRAEILNR